MPSNGEYMEPKAYNKYSVRALLRDELTSVMLQDARKESAWIKEITCISCEGAPLYKNTDFDSEDTDFSF